MSRAAQARREMLVLLGVILIFGASLLAVRVAETLLALPRLVGYLWALTSYRFKYGRSKRG